jgi:hypothetical protein
LRLTEFAPTTKEVRTMRSAVVGLLLVVTLAVAARGGCGPSSPEGGGGAFPPEWYLPEIAKVKTAIRVEKEKWARKVEALRIQIAALEVERVKADAEGARAVDRLTKELPHLEAQLAKSKLIAEGKAPPAPKSPGVEDQRQTGFREKGPGGAEEKLDLILKKLDDLDNRVRKLEGGAVLPSGNGLGVVVSKVRSVSLPVQMDPARRGAVREFVLFVSTDAGRTWTEAARGTPERESISFTAPGNGLYWLSVQVVSRDGRKDPADVTALPPMAKVRFESGGK